MDSTIAWSANVHS